LYNGKVYQPQISLKPAPYANYYPLSIAGCQLWLDAADATTIVIGTGVSQWRDKSGSSNNATQATGSQQPTYTAGTKVAFNKSNSQYMSLPNGTIPFGNSEYSFYFVHTPQSTGIDVVFSSGDYSTTGGTNGLYYNNTLYQNYWFNQDAIMNIGAVVGQRTLIAVTYTQNVNRYISLTGSLQNTTASSNRNSFSTNNIIGAEGPPPGRGYYSSVDFHEFIIYNTGHTTNQRQQIEGYLAWKWGITLANTHPYYSAPPVQYTRGAILGAPTLKGIARLPPIVATGGTITFSGPYKIHTFTTVGSTNFTITSPYTAQVQVLIVGGGGGGGGDRAAGGGGGGLIFLSNTTITPGTYAVTVGDGGLPGWWGPNGGNGRVAGNGGNSIFNGNIAIGGGGAGQHQYFLNGVYQNNGEPYYGAGRAGGSGGGGAAPNPSYPTALGGSPTVGQGYAGGSGFYNGSICCAGGGGGAGGPGGNGLSAAGGAGGPGLQITIGGTTAYYAGGGGGAAAQDYRAAVGGAGGIGGGGQADQSSTVSGVAGTNGLGGGGGGAGNGSGWAGSSSLGGNVAGFAGGSGVVIIAYDYL
jgi:hypothetical protein